MKKGASHLDKLNRLKKIEGQVRGLHRMIEEERYCVDILHTLSSVVGALRNLENLILKDHVNACVRKAFLGRSPSEKNEKLNEILQLLGNFRK